MYYSHSFVALFLVCAWRCCVLFSLFRRVVSCMCLEVLCTILTLSSDCFLYVLGGVVYYSHSFVGLFLVCAWRCCVLFSLFRRIVSCMCLEVLCTILTLSSCCFLYVLGGVVYYSHSFVGLFLVCAWRCCVLFSLFRRIVSCMCLEVLCTILTLSSDCFLYVLGGVVYYSHSFVGLFLVCAWRCCVLFSLFRRVVSCMCLEVLCTILTLSSDCFLFVLGGVVYYSHSFVALFLVCAWRCCVLFSLFRRVVSCLCLEVLCTIFTLSSPCFLYVLGGVVYYSHYFVVLVLVCMCLEVLCMCLEVLCTFSLCAWRCCVLSCCVLLSLFRRVVSCMCLEVLYTTLTLSSCFLYVLGGVVYYSHSFVVFVYYSHYFVVLFLVCAWRCCVLFSLFRRVCVLFSLFRRVVSCMCLEVLCTILTISSRCFLYVLGGVVYYSLSFFVLFLVCEI